MCTISVNVDEHMIREVLPELVNTADISRWVQLLIDESLREMVAKNEDTIDIEEARAMVHETIHKEYSLS